MAILSMYSIGMVFSEKPLLRKLFMFVSLGMIRRLKPVFSMSFAVSRLEAAEVVTNAT